MVIMANELKWLTMFFKWLSEIVLNYFQLIKYLISIVEEDQLFLQSLILNTIRSELQLRTAGLTMAQSKDPCR